MTRNDARRNHRDSRADRVRRKAGAHRSNLEPLEGRLMLDAGAFMQLAPAVPASRQLAAEIAPAVPHHANANGGALVAIVKDSLREHLVITQPPGSPQLFGFIFNGVPFRLAVAVEDSRGRVLTGFDGLLTLSLAANPGHATLRGTVTATAKHGIAVFSNVTLSQPGNGYVLRVSGEGLAVETARFDVQLNQIVYAD
jgi:hypothetical protein